MAVSLCLRDFSSLVQSPVNQRKCRSPVDMLVAPPLVLTSPSLVPPRSFQSEVSGARCQDVRPAGFCAQ